MQMTVLSRATVVPTLVTLVLLVTGCTADRPQPSDSTATSASPRPETTSSATESAAPPAPATGGSAAPTAPLAGGLTGPQQVSADPAAATTLADDLDAPWSIVRLITATAPGGTPAGGTSGAILIDERDTGVIKEILSDGSAGAVGTVPGVAAAGEGGLLGLEPYVDPSGSTGTSGTTGTTGTTGSTGSPTASGTPQTFLYAYETTATDNRVIRMPLVGSPGAFSLGAASDVLTGIPKSGNHNGGRLKFGPDGMLYITAGDAGQSENAQDVGSLSGKILRVTPTGAVPADNPFAGSPVYSLGHRNPQGITWGADGTLYAAEFGQDTWDELNIVTPGGNYGWPTVEGISGRSGSSFIDPIAQWSTDDASPSGLVMVGDTLFMAGLGGERLWSITVTAQVTGTSQPVVVASVFDGAFGRIRDVAIGADSTLLLLTNNTDGRGSPSASDDRLLSVPLQPAAG
ncbi:PQQ-dependent sugar dehydrogenase [Subtercola sp. YIM 133946]|uniref:PQQ-dependent sugar dehydrogenase n=1 Tax=Subtercola sp. YIM 133946 TaxID=3118909 RepID=UPI002F94A02E